MPTLKWTSIILSVAGCRRPLTWTSPSKKFLYKMYVFVVFLLTQSLTVSAILDILFNVKTQEEFGDNLYLSIPMIIACCKMCSFLLNGENIMSLLNSLQEKPYSPANTAEMDIEAKYDQINERVTSAFTILCEFCMVITMVTAVQEYPKNRTLAFRGWIPYNYSLPIVYPITFTYQAVSVTIGSLVNVAYDSLFSGVMFCVYSQLEILGHRLQNITKNDKESTNLCVRHHNYIYEFAAKVNEDFQIVLCVQFVSSIFIICFTLYRITQSYLGSRLVVTCVYAICMLLEIFYFCWYGNEVKLKSLEIPDVIFAGNWANLDNTTKKILLTIMLRATVPIEFTTLHVLSVNIDSFMGVLKTSYSTYNLLQQG